MLSSKFKKRVRFGAATLTLAVTAGLLATTSPAVAAEGDVKRANGYSISVKKTVSGRYVGTWALDSTLCGDVPCATVAIDPDRQMGKAYATDKVFRTGDLDGKYRGPNARQTARVAYLMSKYGTTTSPQRAAALDSAVLTILRPKSSWAFKNSLGKKRLDQTRAAGTIRPMVQSMLNESTGFSGPYNFQVNASTSGSTLTVKFLARSLAGKALRNKPITITVDGSTPYSVTTDSDGRAEFSLGGQSAGEKTVVARLGDLEDWRVLQAASKDRKGTRLLIATTDSSVTKTVKASVKADQVLTVSASSVVAPANLTGTVTIDGSGGDRNLRSSLHGPFASASDAVAAGCATTARYSANSTANADGTYPLATGPGEVGFWTYRVTVGGNSANNPAETCSAPFAAKSQASISIRRASLSTPRNKPASGTFTVGGLAGSDAKTVTVRLYGPFNTQDNVNCSDAKLVRSVEVSVQADGTYDVPPQALSGAGWYGWRANLAFSDLTSSAATACPPTGLATFEAN